MGASHRAVTKVNPQVASKTANPKVEPSVYGRRQHGSSQLTDAAGRFGGMLGTARGQGHAKQLEKPPRPVEKSAEQGSHITGKHREVGGRREGLGRAHSSGEAGNDRGAKGPCCL